MVIIHKLKNYEQFTYQEQNISKFIIEHPDCVLTCNAKELASLSYTSSATVVRLCKKLKYKGYLDFQKQYIKEYNDFNNLYSINRSDDIIMRDVYIRTIVATDNNIDNDLIDFITDNILKYKKVDLYAGDINSTVCKTMCSKLSTLGIYAQTFNSYNDVYLKSINRSCHLSFIISHSGNNKALIDIITKLKSKGLKVISISSPYNDEISDMCYKNIPLFFEQDTPYRNIQYPLSLQYIFDVIYMNLVNQQNKTTQEKSD